jgi:hypothetical protein
VNVALLAAGYPWLVRVTFNNMQLLLPLYFFKMILPHFSNVAPDAAAAA